MRLSFSLAIAGLDPAIHLNGFSMKKMDARSKSGHDAKFGAHVCVSVSPARGEQKKGIAR